MFIQVIEGRVKDPELLRSQVAKWRKEIKPGAKGYLGSTGGVTPDGRGINLIRFDSESSARANSDRPEQGAWWAETQAAFDGEPRFYNCAEVDEVAGGGSNDAGFVQVIQGRAKDQAALRAMASQMEADLKTSRPDVMGMIAAWHGDGGGFTQAVYFRSEEDARQGEKSESGSEAADQFMDLFDGPPTFFDLPEPDLD